MRKIYLMCSGGMSTSLIVTKMKKAAEEQGYDCEIEAFGMTCAAKIRDNPPDILLLAPQARFLMKELEKTMPCPVALIDMVAYGSMNGAKILNMAKKELGD